MIPCDEHDWRVLDARPNYRDPNEQELAEQKERYDCLMKFSPSVRGLPRGAFSSIPVEDGQKIRWYCVRCRTIEETVVAADV